MADLPSASQALAIAGVLPNGSYYLGLCTTDPGSGTSPSNEVTGGSYARQPITVTSGAVAGGLPASFTGMPAISTALYPIIMTLSSGGTYKWGSGTATIASGSYAAGSTVNVTAVSLAIT